MKNLFLIFAMVPMLAIGQISNWRTNPPKPSIPSTSIPSTPSPSRNDNSSSWRNAPQPQPPTRNYNFGTTPNYNNGPRNPYKYYTPYYRYGTYGWYYPSNYYWYDPYGFRNRGQVYIYENGKSDTIRTTPTRFTIGIQKLNDMLGVWATIGNDGFLILDYVTTYEQDNSEFFPYGKITQVDFPMVSDYVQRNIFYIGAGKTLDHKWKLSASIGFGHELVRYRGKDAIGYITFPKYSGNFTTVKLGLIRHYNKVSGKLDYDLNRKYLSLGLGLNF
jgi:hypothetical protein